MTIDPHFPADFHRIFIIRQYFIALPVRTDLKRIDASSLPRISSHANLSISQLSKSGIPTWLGQKRGRQMCLACDKVLSLPIVHWAPKVTFSENFLLPSELVSSLDRVPPLHLVQNPHSVPRCLSYPSNIDGVIMHSLITDKIQSPTSEAKWTWRSEFNIQNFIFLQIWTEEVEAVVAGLRLGGG